MIVPTADPLWHCLRRVRITGLSYAERGPLVWKQHRDSLETLARGDAERGAAMVTDHIEGDEGALLARPPMRTSRGPARAPP